MMCMCYFQKHETTTRQKHSPHLFSLRISSTSGTTKHRTDWSKHDQLNCSPGHPKSSKTGKTLPWSHHEFLLPYIWRCPFCVFPVIQPSLKTVTVFQDPPMAILDISHIAAMAKGSIQGHLRPESAPSCEKNMEKSPWDYTIPPS